MTAFSDLESAKRAKGSALLFSNVPNRQMRGIRAPSSAASIKYSRQWAVTSFPSDADEDQRNAREKYRYAPVESVDAWRSVREKNTGCTRTSDCSPLYLP